MGENSGSFGHLRHSTSARMPLAQEKDEFLKSLP
jgi:hypothetical protein